MAQTSGASATLATPGGVRVPAKHKIPSILLKVLMAVSGLIMVGYLLLHMYGNLKAFAGQAAFDDYAHHLRLIGEPMIPYGGVLWVVRIVLLASLIAHVVSAAILTRRNLKARGGRPRYASSKAFRGYQRTYSSFTLRWGGVVILLYVIFHLLNLTWFVIMPGGFSDSAYVRLVRTFHVVPLVIVYVIAMLAVGFHLRHGVWSALTTLGANVGPRARRNLNLLSIVVAALITIGFLLIPFGVLVGVIK